MNKSRRWVFALLAAVLGAAPGAWSAAHAAPNEALIKPPSRNVAWIGAGVDADIDRALAQAKAQNKPVLLYWGATWCPPCNHLKSTLFNRNDFAQLSKSFVAVHVDGDRPGAQKLGTRFSVRGYPTVILMDAAGQEISRLPGEADAPQIMALLQQGLSGGRPVAQVLAKVRPTAGSAAAPAALSNLEWGALAHHSWETDESKLVKAEERAGVLADLARLATAQTQPRVDASLVDRLWLKALVASDAQRGLKADDAVLARVLAVLGSPAESREHMDLLTSYVKPMLRSFKDLDASKQSLLKSRWDASLMALQGDTTLSRADRVGALTSRIQLARSEGEGKSTAHLADLATQARKMAEALDTEVTDGYERQAVITASAYMLGEAGQWAQSDALLKGNLARSHSPYYLMSQLASNAKKQGRSSEALKWSRMAFERSEGPATRLQWGASYLQTQVELSASDAPGIEATAKQLWSLAAEDPSAFHERSARSLQRVADQLKSWRAASGQDRAPVVARLHQALGGVCAKTNKADGQRATCDKLRASLAS
jgi:thioredoxin-like negative regulator of GroEL